LICLVLSSFGGDFSFFSTLSSPFFPLAGGLALFFESFVSFLLSLFGDSFLFSSFFYFFSGDFSLSSFLPFLGLLSVDLLPSLSLIFISCCSGGGVKGLKFFLPSFSLTQGNSFN
jgi:hypothetical protein